MVWELCGILLVYYKIFLQTAGKFELALEMNLPVEYLAVSSTHPILCSKKDAATVQM